MARAGTLKHQAQKEFDKLLRGYNPEPEIDVKDNKVGNARIVPRNSNQ